MIIPPPASGRSLVRWELHTHAMFIFVIAVFLSSFLLFAVQPMIAKFLLPAFGGTAAVWTGCMLAFQTLLLAGYAYAHLLRVKCSPQRQRLIHCGLLVSALVFLPPVPNLSGVSISQSDPLPQLLWIVAVSIGVPFFLLSATAPLLMEWFRQTNPGKNPNRLYALSNAGSLLALLSFPFVLEPRLSRSELAWGWAFGVIVFVVVCTALACRTWRQASPAATGQAELKSTHQVSIKKPHRWLWIVLPACATGMLLALTNQISQDVTPMPLLWVLPLAVYLVTFILCFEYPRFYVRKVFATGCFAALFALAWMLRDGYLHTFWVQVGGYLSVLFMVGMVCHGELYRLRPNPEKLTGFYLMISTGGALGGLLVALVAPLVFKTFFETPLLAFVVGSVISSVLWIESKSRTMVETKSSPNWSRCAWKLTAASTVLLIVAHSFVQNELLQRSIYFSRSFYGAYRITETPDLLLDRVTHPLARGPARILYSGQIYHGMQFIMPNAANIPTTYYSDQGGLGMLFRALPKSAPRHIGVIGLGAGTISSYGNPGDRIRFYEINPDVIALAKSHFTALSNSPAMITCVLGDARLSMEREVDQSFDVLVLDAFSGDAIPVHLLTEEAMSVYTRHLKEAGTMAFHISNAHLNLEPIVRALALKHGLMPILVPAGMTDVSSGKLPSIWMLLTSDHALLRNPEIGQTITQSQWRTIPEPILWTDNKASILSVLK